MENIISAVADVHAQSRQPCSTETTTLVLQHLHMGESAPIVEIRRQDDPIIASTFRFYLREWEVARDHIVEFLDLCASTKITNRTLVAWEEFRCMQLPTVAVEYVGQCFEGNPYHRYGFDSVYSQRESIASTQ
jgi:hypothetical protein